MFKKILSLFHDLFQKHNFKKIDEDKFAIEYRCKCGERKYEFTKKTKKAIINMFLLNSSPEGLIGLPVIEGDDNCG